jgi:hypothetical protein
MATIVIHGTMTLLSAKHARWWWDSWYDGGFLDAVKRGMLTQANQHDLWIVRGQPVSKIDALQMKWSFWTGTMGQAPAHEGHFFWAGTDDYITREAGAHQLVVYLNHLREFAPEEPLSVIAHSHGCNIVKMASSNAKLSPSIKFRRAVFLACPHFEAAGPQGNFYPYRVQTGRFGKILNLSSESDTVQVGFADALPGNFGKRITDYLPPKAYRVDRDSQAASLYENWNLPTVDKGTTAHTVMHGVAVGAMIGVWIASNMSFREVLQTGGNSLLPVPLGDVGE